MKVQILASAKDDLIEGFHFYEDKEAGLGDYFLSSLYADIEALKLFAGIHPIAYRHFHRALSNRFPFAIYYTQEQDSLLIRAVVDCRRNPSWIRQRIKSL
jgi:hypothetical protein